MNRQRLGAAAAAAVALLLLLGTWRLYDRPDFLLTLADQLWSCF